MNINKFYYKKSKVQQLRGFCATVKNNCSIREGAKELGIEESAVSTQIRYLELELGVKLFDRIHGRLYINDNGKKIYEKATNIVSDIDNLFNYFLMKDNHEYNNTLKIASYDRILIKIMPVLANYMRKNKNIEVKIYNIQKNEAIEKLVKNELDLIIYPFDMNENINVELESTVLAEYNSYWCLYKGHPLEKKDYRDITREDIINSNFGFLKEKIMLSSFEKFIYDGEYKNNLEMINGTVKLLKEAVKNKLLITILSDIYIKEEDKEYMVFKNSSALLPPRTYNILINKRHKDITIEMKDMLLNKKPIKLDIIK